MISLNDVLLAMSNIPVDDPIAEIWGRGLQSGYKIIEYTGTFPITITANGDALLDYRIYGADGGVGERVDITGLSEPLCGIQTYTDSLDLSTGILTRKIKKLVLTGEEQINEYSSGSTVKYVINMSVSKAPLSGSSIGVSTHYFYGNAYSVNNTFSIDLGFAEWYRKIIIKDNRFTTTNDFKSFLADQYAAETPVTIWYVLAEPDVSTISIPSGLTGTIEGYLIQDGTPTPEAPIYPTANGVKQADGTYSIEYGYKLPMVISDQNLLPDNISQFGDGYISSSGGVDQQVETRKEKYSNYVNIIPNTSYTFAMANGFPGNPSEAAGEKPWRTIAFYKQNKTFITRLPVVTTDALKTSPLTVTSPSNAFFTRVSWRSYGSKECPVLAADRDLPVYIGENQLDADEYVSYGEQKIHKRTENLIPSPEAQTQTSNGVTATCDGNGVYTFTGTVGENTARFEFPIEEFTTPNLSDTNFVISLFNAKGLSESDAIGIGGVFYISPANRVIKNPSPASNKKVSKISFNFQPNRETNFTMSPMLVLGTVAPSQFAPYMIIEDPPVPLPEIPTIKGETVIDYDGDPKPSQVYVKYKGKSDGA